MDIVKNLTLDEVLQLCKWLGNVITASYGYDDGTIKIEAGEHLIVRGNRVYNLDKKTMFELDSSITSILTKYIEYQGAYTWESKSIAKTLYKDKNRFIKIPDEIYNQAKEEYFEALETEETCYNKIITLNEDICRIREKIDKLETNLYEKYPVLQDGSDPF